MEGGLYPWRRQKIKRPKNGVPGTCRYADLSKPLPAPPEGQMWVQDEASREWSLVPIATATPEDQGDTNTAVLCPLPPADAAASDADASGIRCATAVPVAVESATPLHGRRDDTAGIRYHDVLPTDTFQGICLRYRVTPTELRRANRMMGSNLKLAPERLTIPANDRNVTLDAQRERTKEEKIAALLSMVPWNAKRELSYPELRSYLEIADWDVVRAVEDVKGDFGVAPVRAGAMEEGKVSGGS